MLHRSILSLRNLSKSFLQIPAVSSVSFDALPGHITGYLGPNGSGKSTTMKIITGLLQPSSGEVLFNGQPVILNPIAFQQRLGYVPEEPHLYSHLSGLEYLTMVAGLLDLPTAQSRPASTPSSSSSPSTRTATFPSPPIPKACARKSC